MMKKLKMVKLQMMEMLWAKTIQAFGAGTGSAAERTSTVTSAGTARFPAPSTTPTHT
eukprot:gene1644-25053_t